MFEAWGRGLYRARRLTLVLAAAFAVAAGVWGTGVFSKLTSGNTFTPPSSESNRETTLATSVFGRDEADVVVLYHSAATTVADPAYRQAVAARAGTLPAADVPRHHVLVERAGQPRLHRPALYLRRAAARGEDDAARQDTYKAIKGDFPTAAGNRPTGSPPRWAAPCPPKSPSTARSPAASRAPSPSRCPSC